MFLVGDMNKKLMCVASALLNFATLAAARPDFLVLPRGWSRVTGPEPALLVISHYGMPPKSAAVRAIWT